MKIGKKGSARYLYDSKGNKIEEQRKVANMGILSHQTRYCDNFIFEDGVLKRILVDGGFIYFGENDTTYYYFLKDHLGSNRAVVNMKTGEVAEQYDYYPFGKQHGDYHTGYIHPYRYNGKELDEIGGLDWLHYGARMMEPEWGRFTTPDPLAEKYYDVSPYAYCLNNPMKYVDLKGMAPGDFFKTINEAAIDFGIFYNDNSIRDNREYGSTIFQVNSLNGESGYTYTIANVGTPDGVVVSPSPNAQNDVATIHTHGAYTGTNYDNEFSGIRNNDNRQSLMSKDERKNQRGNNDIGNANKRGIYSYVVTPNGSLQKYDPNSNEVSIISNDMPSDTKDPDRLNNNDARERNNYSSGEFLNMLHNVFFKY